MDIIWEQNFGKYVAQVIGNPIDSYKGVLIISDPYSSVMGSFVHREEVTLSYGATFGPDISDCEYWWFRANEVIDKLERGNK
jgi:hypothetical protein